MISGSSERLIRSNFQGVNDRRKATKSGKCSERVVLLGDARTWDERGGDIEETEHRVLDGKRIRDERTVNSRGARMEAFGGGQIHESEERPGLSKYRQLTKIGCFRSFLVGSNWTICWSVTNRYINRIS